MLVACHSQSHRLPINVTRELTTMVAEQTLTYNTISPDSQPEVSYVAPMNVCHLDKCTVRDSLDGYQSDTFEVVCIGFWWFSEQ